MWGKHGTHSFLEGDQGVPLTRNPDESAPPVINLRSVQTVVYRVSLKLPASASARGHAGRHSHGHESDSDEHDNFLHIEYLSSWLYTVGT